LVAAAACAGRGELPREPVEARTGASTAASGATSAGGLTATVRRVGGVVEVEVSSDTSLGDGAMPPILVIGDRAFRRSRNPPDGRLETRIFTIDAAAFDALPEGAEMSLGTLHPSARLTVPPAGGTADGTPAAPAVTPQHVAPGRRLLGHLSRARMEVAP
jgi:hypothetical protein